jgi:hypothetical protein
MAIESLNNIINKKEVSLKVLILKTLEWWKFLLSKWVVILTFGLMGGVLGFAYAYLNKPIYTATTTFVLEEGNEGRLGSLSGLASMAGVDLGGSESNGMFHGDNILQLYKSRIMIEKTLLTEVVDDNRKQLLINRFIDFNKLRDKWKSKPSLANIKFDSSNIKDRLKDSVIGVIVIDINKNYLNVTKPDKKLNTIQADVKAKDEFFAKAFNEAIVKNVNDFYVETKTKKAKENVEILQRKTDSVRAVMNGFIYTAAATVDATPNLNPTRQIQRVVPMQRSQISIETNKAILSTLIQNLEMAKYTLTKEAPLIQVIDVPIYPLEKDRVGKAKGIIVGGILAGFFICFVLIARRLLKIVLA